MVRVAQNLGCGSGRRRALRHTESLATDQIPIEMDEGRGRTWYTGHRYSSFDKNYSRKGDDFGKNRAQAAGQSELTATDR